ncbi:MAG: DUF2179 domain-containing protein [Chloroflexi bacterium]|jgi:uncharacterized protein YebE (UPF0316 family)|nr:DUF2179 domain-containing protein [Chloroflexota bacterium]
MFEIFLSPVAWLGALGIFALRVSDMTCDTLRMLFVVRGRKGIAWVLGFVQSVIFVIAITSVLQHLDNPLNVIGYAAGFATGNVVGMWIEERLAIGHVKISIVTQRLGALLSQVLRDSGFGVTEIPARGRDGKVSMLSVSVLRKDVSKVEDIVHATDAEAFVISEDVRPLRRGFWRA